MYITRWKTWSTHSCYVPACVANANSRATSLLLLRGRHKYAPWSIETSVYDYPVTCVLEKTEQTATFLPKMSQHEVCLSISIFILFSALNLIYRLCGIGKVNVYFQKKILDCDASTVCNRNILKENVSFTKTIKLLVICLKNLLMKAMLFCNVWFWKRFIKIKTFAWKKIDNIFSVYSTRSPRLNEVETRPRTPR